MSNGVDVPTWWDGTVRTWSSRPLAAVLQVAVDAPASVMTRMRATWGHKPKEPINGRAALASPLAQSAVRLQTLSVRKTWKWQVAPRAREGSVLVWRTASRTLRQLAEALDRVRFK